MSIWEAAIESLDSILLIIALQIMRRGNAVLLGPYFGRFVTLQITSPLYLALSLGSIFSVEMLRFISKSKVGLIAFGLVFFNPVIIQVIKESAFESGSVRGPVACSAILFIATGLLQNSSCRSVVTGERSFAKSIFALAMVLYVEKYGFNNFQLLYCDLNRLCLVFIGVACSLSLYIRLSRHSLYCLLTLLALSAISKNFYQALNVRQCLPASTSTYVLNENLTIHARAESMTGFVSVVECPSNYGRVLLMKCDHSILGGQYLEYDRDSIFAIFYKMDFVRFVKRKGMEIGRPKRALVVGLGIGVSAKTLIDSEVDVDVVEIDPILFQYAIDYFEMPRPKNAYLQDARLFFADRYESVYDYIIHDVFSGGVVNHRLFSVEALSLAKRSLLENGVFVVNFVGKLDSMASKSVIATLQTVFKNIISVPEDSNDENVQNCLYFATDFGESIEFDFLQDKSYSSAGSYVYTLERFKEQPRIVPERVDEALAIFDGSNPLEREQYTSALLHFDIIGQIFNQKHFWTELF